MPDSINPMGLFNFTKKKESKPVRPLVGIRNSRVDAILGGLAPVGLNGAKIDPSRSFQGYKDVYFSSALNDFK